MHNDNHGFFLLGQIKNFPKIKTKLPEQAEHLNNEIVSKLQTAFPGYICSTINDKYFYIIAPNIAKDEQKAKYSAIREPSVGLGVIGFHSFLQSKMIPLESVVAKVWNKKIFKHIYESANAASKELAIEKSPCPDAADCGIMERFSNKTAIAPTASISIICGNSSPGIEPYAANSFTQKTLSGSFTVRNKHLVKLL